MIRHGDFTQLAKYYVNRPGYSKTVLSVIAEFVKTRRGSKLTVADVGAGTGKLAENLTELGFGGYAVEPNDAMREEGIKYISARFDTASAPSAFVFSAGSAEATGLVDCSVDWVLMGSSFHWAKTAESLAEFNRILKENGAFTAIYNPRDIAKNELQKTIETKIKEIVPELSRVSSGAADNMRDMEAKITSSPYFDDLFFVEAPHIEVMTKERYLGAWLSVNDIQYQAGEARWGKIVAMIENEISGLNEVEVHYKIRAWTVTKR